MELRNTIKEKIEQMRREMGRILSGLRLTNTEGASEPSAESVQQALREKTGLDMNSLLLMEDSDLIQTADEQLGHSDENIELLADILTETGIDVQQPYWHKALLLLEAVQERSTTYSLERAYKIEHLKQRIDRAAR